MCLYGLVALADIVTASPGRRRRQRQSRAPPLSLTWPTLRPLIFTHEQAKDCKFLRFLNKPSLKGDKPHCRRGPLWCVLAFDPQRARSSIR